ncbi:MAG: alpha/beta hydrolase [Planctomycetota bacterium]
MRSLLLLLLLASPWVSTVAEEAKIDPPPKGFKSPAAVKLALIAGRVPLIDTRLETPKTVSVEKGIEYGKNAGRALNLDLYSPKETKEPRAGLVFIHGGAWRSGKRGDYHFYGVKFAEAGYVVATITYGLAPTHPFPAAIHDAKCAVRWMRKNAKKLGVDPTRLGVVGGSAGGHLALLVGYTADVKELEGNCGHAGVSSRVQAVVDIYGPTDLTTSFATGHSSVIDFLGGKKIDEARPTYELASPITHLDAKDPPTLILHGTIDEVVPIAQADALAKKLKELKVPHEYDRLEGWPHAMDIAKSVNRRGRQLMLRFFSKHLAAPKKKDAASNSAR